MDWLSSIVGRPLCFLIALEGNCKGYFRLRKGRPLQFLMAGTDDLGEQTCHHTWVAAVGANSFFRKKIQVKCY